MRPLPSMKNPLAVCKNGNNIIFKSKEIRLKTVSLRKQITYIFLLICLLPIVIGSCWIGFRFNKNLQKEAIDEILSKEQSALLIYKENENFMKNLALSYARQKTVSFLIPYNLGPKIGQELNRLAKMDHLDQVIVINDRNQVIARSNFPDMVNDTLTYRAYFDLARTNQAYGFTEKLSPEQLSPEGDFDATGYPKRKHIISLTGVAPVKETESNNIIGVVIIRRFIRETSSDLIQHISRSLEVHASMYLGSYLISSSISPDRSTSVFSPDPQFLKNVLETNQPDYQFQFARGGHIAAFSPVLDYQNQAVAVLTLHSDVRRYIEAWDMLVAGLSGVLLIGIGMVWLLFRFMDKRIFQPLRKLKHLAAQIAAGNKSDALTVISNDEIGELTSAFNHMAIQLQLTHQSVEAEIKQRLKSETELKQAYDELELRVLERTRDLTEANISLQQEVQDRKRAEAFVQASLSEKDMLLKEIHHRVKNNLQIISSLLDMSQTRTPIPLVADALAGARSKIHTMSLIHTQLYQSNRFDKIEMESHIHSLGMSLSQMYGLHRCVSIQIDAKGLELPIPQAIPCAMVLNELISNSLKHAFKNMDGGNISIHMKKNSDSIYLEVSDDGIGFPDDISAMTATSLGIKLIRNLVLRQLKGKLTINRNNGTEVKIIFPVGIV